MDLEQAYVTTVETIEDRGRRVAEVIVVQTEGRRTGRKGEGLEIIRDLAGAGYGGATPIILRDGSGRWFRVQRHGRGLRWRRMRERRYCDAAGRILAEQWLARTRAAA